MIAGTLRCSGGQCTGRDLTAMEPALMSGNNGANAALLPVFQAPQMEPVGGGRRDDGNHPRPPSRRSPEPQWSLPLTGGSSRTGHDGNLGDLFEPQWSPPVISGRTLTR